MAATIAVTRVSVPGDRHTNIITITGDTSYPTGGYAITPALCGLTSVIEAAVSAGVTGGDYLQYDATNAKVRFIVAATGAEVASTTNVSAVSPVLVVSGV